MVFPISDDNSDRRTAPFVNKVLIHRLERAGDCGFLVGKWRNARRLHSFRGRKSVACPFHPSASASRFGAGVWLVCFSRSRTGINGPAYSYMGPTTRKRATRITTSK